MTVLLMDKMLVPCIQVWVVVGNCVFKWVEYLLYAFLGLFLCRFFALWPFAVLNLAGLLPFGCVCTSIGDCRALNGL